jgi:hypothetical protein
LEPGRFDVVPAEGANAHSVGDGGSRAAKDSRPGLADGNLKAAAERERSDRRW